MKTFYLTAAIIGAIIPYFFFTQFIALHGINLPAFATALFVNGAAAGFSSDLLITSFIFWAFMFHRRKVHEAPKPWIYIFLNLTIGLSCALPAYLWTLEKNKS